MGESEVTVGKSRDLGEGQEVKEALKDFFLCGTRRGKKCAICSENQSSVKLGEEALSVVYKALLLVPSEDYLLKQPSPLWMCAKCSITFNTLADLVFQLEELRCQFNDLRRIVGRQVILGSLGRSEKEWELWEEETKVAEDLLTSSVVTRGEKQVQKKSADVCDFVPEKEVKIQEDIKLHKMTAVVVLERLKEDSETEIPELSETFWFEDESHVKSEVIPIESAETSDVETETRDINETSVSTDQPLRLLRKRRHVNFTETDDENDVDEEDFFVPSDASDVTSDEDETVMSKDSSSAEDEIVKSPSDKSKPFPCPRCEKTFKRKDIVERHIAEVHDTRKTCSVCNLFFIRQTDLIRHEVKVHSIFPPEMTSEIPCTHCDATFTDLTTLNKHKLKKHLLGSTSAGDLQCQFCLKFFVNKTAFRQHQRKAHYGGRPPPREGKEEIEGHSPQNIYCFVCKTIQSPLTLEDLKAHEETPEHKQKIRSKSSAYCDVCRLNFAWNPEALQVHLKSSEHQKEVDNLGKFDDTTFCIPCRKNFNNSKQLQTHATSLRHAEVCLFREKEETTEKMPCPSCPQTFDLQGALDLHILHRHAPSGYSCKFCKKSFTDRNGRDSHQRRSHRPKVYPPSKCPHCAASFKSVPCLRKHSYFFHPEQTLLHSPHPCLLCFRTFPTADELEAHTKTSHAPLKGPTCGRQCRDTFHFKRHAKGCFEDDSHSHVTSELADQPLRLLRKRRHVNFTETEDENDVDEEDVFVPSDASDVTSDEDETAISRNSSSVEDEIIKSPTEKSKRFPCPRCQKMFMRRDIVRRHIAKVHTQKTCSICQRVFARQTDLIRHQVKVHSVFPPEMTSEISCTHCDATFTDPATLNKHRLNKHLLGSTTAGDLQCQFCLKFFVDLPAFRQHLRKSHYGGRFPPKDEIKGHSPQNIYCFVCKTTQSPLTLEDLKAHEESPEHKQKIRSKSSAFCDVCRLNFAWNLESLRLHLKSPEHQKEVDSLGKFDDTTFCIPCRKKFKVSRKLQIHTGSLGHTEACLFRVNEQTEDNSKSQPKKPCPSCPHTFDLQGALDLHILRNHAPSGYSCKFCNESFPHRNDLAAHQRRSHRDKISSPKKCPHCAASFKRAPNLRKHSYFFHPEQTLLHAPHPCLLCFHVFPSADELEAHTKTIHAHLKCPTCGKQCRDGFDFKKHTQTHNEAAKSPSPIPS